ncbi:hypothetical protein [Spirulina sp. 06S082]|nr:hypothetical protein [Spirulina sp. 06S082]MEA5467440.1 hypothetical protein [Spirulina sp. 06S082]
MVKSRGEKQFRLQSLGDRQPESTKSLTLVKALAISKWDYAL